MAEVDANNASVAFLNNANSFSGKFTMLFLTIFSIGMSTLLLLKSFSLDNEDLVEVHDQTTEFPKRAPSSLTTCALVLDATFNNRNLKTRRLQLL